MQSFVSPQVIYGESALGFLKTLNMEKCLIVTDRVLSTTPLLSFLKTSLPSASSTMVFSDIGAEPSYEEMTRSMPAINEFSPDHIIALGGGSVMDTAKMILFRYARPDTALYDLKPGANLGLKKKARLIAVPTTSGTGSECSWASVIMDESKKRKVELASLEILPDFAILDPSTVLDLPLKQTVSTAVDAITHSIEGYVSNRSNYYSDAFSEKGLELITENITEVLADPHNSTARNAVHIGASMAGVSFSNSQIGLAHALGHALGAVFMIPHGTTVGLYLPSVIEFNDPEVHEKYERLNRLLPLKFRKATLRDSVTEIFRVLGQPTDFADTGQDIGQYKSEFDHLTTLAMKSSGVAANPRKPTTEEVLSLLKSVS